MEVEMETGLGSKINDLGLLRLGWDALGERWGSFMYCRLSWREVEERDIYIESLLGTVIRPYCLGGGAFVIFFSWRAEDSGVYPVFLT